MVTEREDIPTVGLFKRHYDAIHQASRWAALFGYRHRVRYDPANRWWHVTMLATRVRTAEGDLYADDYLGGR